MSAGVTPSVLATQPRVLTRNQVLVLALLRTASCDENAMEIRWPRRSREDIRRTVASLLELGLIDEHEARARWSINNAGCQALGQWS